MEAFDSLYSLLLMLPALILPLNQILGNMKVSTPNFKKYGIFLLLIFMYAFSHSQKLLSYNLGECEKYSLDELRQMREGIIGQGRNGDTLLLKISFIAGCELNFKDFVHLIEQGGDTLSLSYERVCETCPGLNCVCLFSLDYEILLAEGTDSLNTYLFRGREIDVNPSKYKDLQKPTFAIHNGDTVNRVDEYGIAYGVRVEYDKRKQPVGEWISYSLDTDYYLNGIKRDYYRSGTIKREQLQVYLDKIWIRKYNRRGKLIEELFDDPNERKTENLKGKRIEVAYTERGLLKSILIYDGEELVEVME